VVLPTTCLGSVYYDKDKACLSRYYDKVAQGARTKTHKRQRDFAADPSIDLFLDLFLNLKKKKNLPHPPFNSFASIYWYDKIGGVDTL